ncbi:serine hydrolase domain-containing protein [Xanthocytophaga agilis]|uniref:Serine hydrolase domain-containing protein n=1 Tax=Xanthocytophaga agilis TaxID=3048010 RepID=A0AAE3UGL6_9BACT|nr:serine hydrolase domain-containing protein [Xanthocytophaga agilis]MDJ1504510.1 serine hydrolase domain-containing protein [Xanthocytophaga agilis]
MNRTTTNQIPPIFLKIYYCLWIIGIIPLNLYAQKSYQPPYFEDTKRLTKIKKAIPVIEELYKGYAEKNNFPGFVFGVVVDGNLIYADYTGYTDLKKKTVVNTKSVFRIASMTKSFTAMAILKLRDKGKLNLDDPVSKYIPQFAKVQTLTKDSPPITIRHLLTHSAGFPEDNPWGDRQLADTDVELLQLVEGGITFSNAPGLQYEYSNLGFALLGNIITKVSGKPYQQYITETICKPLGMTSTYWEYTKVPADQLAHGYRRLNDQWQEEALLHDGSYGAMGGMLTSIEDFSRYMALHLQAWPPRDEADNGIIKRSSLREMHQLGRINTLNAQYKYPSGRLCPTVSGYNFGLRWTKDCDNRVSVGHSGGLPGFGSNWSVLPDYGIGVVCFSNLTYAPTGAINVQVLDSLITLAELKPRKLPVSSILEKRKNEIIALLPDWKNAVNSGIFAENFFPDNPLEILQTQSAEIFANAGKVIKVRELMPENQLRGVFIMEGEKANIQVSFTLTPEKNPLIQEFHINAVKK